MSDQGLKDTGGGAPASHCQNLPMTITGKGCYTASGAKTAGPEREGGARWHNGINSREAVLAAIIQLLQSAELRELNIILQFVRRIIQ